MPSIALIYLAAAILLLTAGIASLIAGKTIGLYGMIEPRSSIFFWVIVVTYLGLGAMSLFSVTGRFLR